MFIISFVHKVEKVMVSIAGEKHKKNVYILI